MRRALAWTIVGSGTAAMLAGLVWMIMGAPIILVPMALAWAFGWACKEVFRRTPMTDEPKPLTDPLDQFPGLVIDVVRSEFCPKGEIFTCAGTDMNQPGAPRLEALVTLPFVVAHPVVSERMVVEAVRTLAMKPDAPGWLRPYCAVMVLRPLRARRLPDAKHPA